jgi:hypothetical protein
MKHPHMSIAALSLVIYSTKTNPIRLCSEPRRKLYYIRHATRNLSVVSGALGTSLCGGDTKIQSRQ